LKRKLHLFILCATYYPYEFLEPKTLDLVDRTGTRTRKRRTKNRFQNILILTIKGVHPARPGRVNISKAGFISFLNVTMNNERPKFRNAFSFEEEAPVWKEALNEFPNKVPRFETKDEAMEFTRAHCRVGSNPDTPHLLHSVTTLISWEQIVKHLIPRIKKYNEQWSPVQPTEQCLTANRFTAGTRSTPQQSNSSEVDTEGREALLFDYLKSRLDLSIHQEMSMQSTFNTLQYMFFHMKCGIFVMIRNNRVVIFCPFVNEAYKN
jgi:hypothetical protein